MMIGMFERSLHELEIFVVIPKVFLCSELPLEKLKVTALVQAALNQTGCLFARMRKRIRISEFRRCHTGGNDGQFLAGNWVNSKFAKEGVF